MTNKGFIKLPRNITEDGYYFSEIFTRTQAWIDLIILANYQDTPAHIRGVKIVVKRGQVCRSLPTLVKRWKWSRGKVIRFFENLVAEGKIKVHSNNVTNLYTICNYEEYQGNGTPDGTASGTANRTQIVTAYGTANSPLSTGDTDAFTDIDGTADGSANGIADRTLNDASDGTRLKNKRNKEDKNNILSNPLFISDNGQQKLRSEDERHFSFNAFWNLYDKNVGQIKCGKLFCNLSENDIEKIFKTLPAYIASTPDKKYRKDPGTYLQNRAWEDEIVLPTTDKKKEIIDLGMLA